MFLLPMGRKFVRRWIAFCLAVPIYLAMLTASGSCPPQDIADPVQSHAARKRHEFLNRIFTSYAKTFDSREPEQILRELQTVKSMLSAPFAGQCFERLEGFAKALNDEMYIDRENQFTTLPEWLSGPKARQAVYDFDLPELRRLVASVNKKRPADKQVSLMHMKTNIATLALIPSRIVIVDPDDKGLIKWMGLDDFEGAKKLVAAQMGLPITAVKTDGEKRTGVFVVDPKTELFYAKDWEHTDKGFSGKYVRQTCQNCHNEGPIYPLISQMLDEESRSALTYALGHHFPAARPVMRDGKPGKDSGYGPEIGQQLSTSESSEGRGAKFFYECLKSFREGRDWLEKSDNQLAELVKKVRPKMDCAKCHNGVNTGPDSAGILRFPMGMDVDTVSGKPLIHTRIMEGNMPKDSGHSLTEFERLTLSNCLSYEYYGFPARKAGNARTIPSSLSSGKLYEWITEFDCGPKTCQASPAALHEDVRVIPNSPKTSP